MTSAFEGIVPQKVEGGRDAIGAAITGGIIGQAARGGFAVADDAAAALEQANAPAVQEVEEAPAPPPDPVDAIVESLQAQDEDERGDVSAEVEQEDDEFSVPDFEAQADAELLNEQISGVSEEGYEDDAWDDDPEVNEARKRAIIAEKKAAYYENLTAQRETKKWEAEADKHFPMWRARGEVKAKSKRDFFRQAKASHEAVKPFVKAAVKTREEQLQAERASMRDEVKQEAAEAWGKPTVESATSAPPAQDFKGAYRKARINQDLPNMLRLKREYAQAGGDPDDLMGGE